MNPNQGSDPITVDDAAAQAAGRGLATAVLQRNPIVAVAAALLGPIIGLFRRRSTPAPTTVNKLKLESYSSTPCNHDQTSRANVERRTSEGRAKDVPLRHSFPARARVRRAPAGVAAAQKGGTNHG